MCVSVRPSVGRFKIKDVKPTEAGESSKVKVKVRMNIHGVFKIKSATMVEKCPPEPEQSATDTTPAENMDTEPATPQTNLKEEEKGDSNCKGEEGADDNGSNDAEQNGSESVDQGHPESMDQDQSESKDQNQSESKEQSHPESMEVRADACWLVACVQFLQSIPACTVRRAHSS